ncbi:MAG TPA: hypothetical protein V6C76_13630 [Drouetiella sp.]
MKTSAQRIFACAVTLNSLFCNSSLANSGPACTAPHPQHSQTKVARAAKQAEFQSQTAKLSSFNIGVDTKLSTPKIDLTFDDGSHAHAIFYGATTEDISDPSFDPAFDSNNDFVFYMPLGLYQTVLQMCASYKQFEVDLLIDAGERHQLPVGSYYFYFSRASKSAGTVADLGNVDSGAITAFNVFISNAGSFRHGNGNLGAFAIPYGPNDGHANPVIDLCFKDFATSFDRAYLNPGGGEMIHVEVPGDLASGLFNVLNSIDKVPLKFTWKHTEAVIEAQFPGPQKAFLKVNVGAIDNTAKK